MCESACRLLLLLNLLFAWMSFVVLVRCNQTIVQKGKATKQIKPERKQRLEQTPKSRIN